MRSPAILLPAGVLLACLAPLARAADAVPQTPRIAIAAEFATKTRCPIFQLNDTIEVAVTVDGARLVADTLDWSVTDVRDQVVMRQAIAVPRGDQRWEERLRVPSTTAGYFQVNLRLAKAEIMLPAAGTRPAGFVAYGVLPAIDPLVLPSTDRSRFGAQGTCFIRSGRQLVGDPVDPVYPLLGARWIYCNRRPAELAAAGPDSYQPQTSADLFRKNGMFEASAGLCLLIDAHSVPSWLMDFPAGVKPKANPNPSFDLQAYPPKDFAAYQEIIGRIAAEQAVRRQTLFPAQEHSYYEIHWEPDWHWKGSDEAFIGMYAAAHQAIRQNDPRGLLLGLNDGVLATGNSRLRRLLAAGLGKHLDGIVTHTYYIPLEQTPEAGGLVRDMRELVALVRRSLPAGAPIINTEWGLNYFGRRPEDDPAALRREAAWFLRGHLIALGEGADTTFFFYTADPGRGGGGLLYNLTAPHPSFGATHVAPKPVFLACATATRLLEGSQTVGVVDYLGDDVLGYAFDRAGERILALWSTDDRARTVAVPSGTSPITGLDPMGNASLLACSGGVVRAALSAMPVWLRGVPPSTLPRTPATPSAASLNIPAALLPGERLPAAKWPAGITELRQFTPNGWQRLDGTIPRTQPAGTILLGAFRDAQASLPAVTMRLDVLPVVALSRAREEGTSQAISVCVSNLTDRTLRGNLVFDDGRMSLTSHVAAIRSGRMAVAGFDRAAIGTQDEPERAFTATFIEEGGSRVRRALPPGHPILLAHRVPSPPQIDGDLRKWPLERFELRRGKGPDGREISCRLAIAHDADRLLIAVRVPDRSHVQHESPSDAWRGDSIQLGLAAEGHFEAGDWQKFCFSLDPVSGTARGFCHEGPPALKGLLDGHDVSFAVRRDDSDETVYEVAVPWRRLGMTTAPEEIRLGLLVNQVDIEQGLPTERRFADILGGMAWSHPAEFARVRIAP